MRISGHTWTRTIKTQDKIPEKSAILMYVLLKMCLVLPPNQAMWPSTTNVSHDK